MDRLFVRKSIALYLSILLFVFTFISCAGVPNKRVTSNGGNKSSASDAENKESNLSSSGSNSKSDSISSSSENSSANEVKVSDQNGNMGAEMSKISPEIIKIAKKYKAVGASVTVVKNGNKDGTVVYGYADKEKSIKVEPDTAFRIASISKTVSSLVLMTLWDKGLVNLDADISDYLKFKVRNPRYLDKPITVRSLLTHTSSISDYGTYNNVVDSGAEYPSLVDILTPKRPGYSSKNFNSFSPDKGHFEYSNFGAGIVAAVVESITGERFSDYSNKVLFKPLGLDASFLPNDISSIDKIANIYSGGYLSYSKSQALNEKEKVDRLPIGQNYRLAQGNLYISSGDLSKIMILLMGDGTYEGKRIISKQAVDMMNSIQWRGSSGFNKMVGLGVHITDDLVNGRRLRGHQGRAYGSTAEMFYDTKDKTGVVYLSNGSKDIKAQNGFTAIGSEIVNEVYKNIN